MREPFAEPESARSSQIVQPQPADPRPDADADRDLHEAEAALVCGVSAADGRQLLGDVADRADEQICPDRAGKAIEPMHGSNLAAGSSQGPEERRPHAVEYLVER